MSLSAAQAAAAHRLDQDVCVVAGPGSGKTRVLIERFSWLVLHREVSPQRILAITFTEKAATEIKERLIKEFADRLDIREQIERAYVSTIDAFCARLLRENAIAAGVDPAFQVLDESQSRPLLHDVVDQVLDDLYRDEPERMRRFLRSIAVGTLRGSFVPDIAASLIDIYDMLRTAGAPVSELRRQPPSLEIPLGRLKRIAAEILEDRVHPSRATQQQCHEEALEWARRIVDIDAGEITPEFLSALRRKKINQKSLVDGSAARRHELEIRELALRVEGTAITHYYEPERELIAAALEQIDRRYRERKRTVSGLDFSDLEEAAIRLLETDTRVRTTVRNSFDYVLMDELQDTNPLQWNLMRLVRAPSNFFAVGDVNQSIYGFRYADPSLFHGYRKSLADADLHIDELRTNYRTRATVLDAVNRVFVGVDGVEPHVLESGSSFCEKSGLSVETIVALAEASEPGEALEAKWIARRITELVGSLPVAGGRPAKFGDIAILTRANQSTADLQSALDEFGVPSIVLGGQTFFETREVRDLKLLLDVLVNPCNEVSLAGLLRSPMLGVSDEDLLRWTDQHGSLAKGVRREPPAAWSTIEELRKVRNLVSPDRLLRRVLDESDYESGLTDRGRSNVEKFLAALRERYSRAPRPLREIVAGIEQAAPEAEAPPADVVDAVRLMTMHKAKGLEFPIVFLPYLHKPRSNEFPVISYTREHGLGIKWRHPATGEPSSDCTREANKAVDRAAREHEENRLLYVGMTRAKEHLVLSWTQTKKLRANTWASTVARALAVDVDTAPVNEPVETPGLRLLVADREPEAATSSLRSAVFDAPRTVEAASAQALYDSATSVTDVSRFAECPRKYFFSRYLKQERPRMAIADIATDLGEDAWEIDADDVDAAELGTQVHQLLAGQPLESPATDAVRLAERFRSSELGRMAAQARLKAYEWDFVLAQYDIVLRGQIDLWFEAGKDLIIVDYKTDSVRAPIDPEAILGYSLQLQIYASALERATGRTPTRAVLHFLRPDVAVDVDISPLARGAAFDKLVELKAAQHSLDFARREGYQCARCDYARECGRT